MAFYIKTFNYSYNYPDLSHEYKLRPDSIDGIYETLPEDRIWSLHAGYNRSVWRHYDTMHRFHVAYLNEFPQEDSLYLDVICSSPYGLGNLTKPTDFHKSLHKLLWEI